jgi:endonuclease YncB( thermonuclease family)
VKFLGVDVIDKKRAVEYLREYVLKRDVMIKVEEGSVIDENTIFAYVYLKNKIFVNAYLIKSGIAQADKKREYKLREKLLKIENQRKCV